MDDMRSTTHTVMGLRTRVLEEGESTRDDPVLMIHGVGGWAENWREVMTPIARTGRRAIAVDLPGFPLLARAFGRRSRARDVLRTCFYDARRIPETLYAEAERYGYASFGEFVRALSSGVTIRGVKASVRGHWLAQKERFQGPALV